MSKSQTLRALVNERLTAAAEEIFALFERTIAEYEEEVCRSKEENQRKQELLDSILSPSKSPGPGLNQDPPHTPRIKEEPQEPQEPEELSVKQEEHTLLVQVSVGVPESSAVCVKTEESSLLQQRQTELREETQGENISAETHLHSSDTADKVWRARFSCSAAQMETDADGDHDNQVQKGQRLRALVKEIFALFEKMIAEYEKEVCRSKEESQRKQKLLDSALSPSKTPDPGLNQNRSQTPRIKEEPQEPSVKQEEDALLVQVLVGVPESSTACATTEESSLLQQRQTELREETQGEDISAETHLHSETEGDTENSSDTDDEDWRAPLSCSTAQMETDADGDHYNQVQNSSLSPKYKSAPETSATVNNADMSGTAEGAEDKKHQCSVCQKRFGTVQKLQRHIIIHTGEKPFSCSTCEKTFNQKANLDKHEKLHNGEKPHTCIICKKTFTQKTSLDYHLMIHTGEKPYSCLICKKTFTKKTSLEYHVKIHTGEKPYSCLICKKTFAHKVNLSYHVKKHTGEKPFRCSTCDKAFAIKGHLDKHLKIHTGERPFSCSMCEKTFATKYNRDKHETTHRETVQVIKQ
ncbi:zinc finger protein 3-like [Boleophthalmus pectinirostris]|uniref:zinc finger protein 3-like n=1 Tax=Boleophthalmus pectinirostris TaxID=150288 RepID=UPI00242F713F|nr:zinc finger protein 3-like [Boleophthalmus pectinirostris]